jgi:hypothetical protein
VFQISKGNTCGGEKETSSTVSLRGDKEKCNGKIAVNLLIKKRYHEG